MSKPKTRCGVRRLSLDETYLRMAELWGSERSYGIRAKVGALIVKDGQIISDGYNGMPSGEPNEEMELFEPATGEWYTNPLALHAESNAIMKLTQGPQSCAGATMYVTFSPCSGCVKLILQSKIKRIVFRKYFRDTDGLPILARRGVELVHLPGETSDPV